MGLFKQRNVTLHIERAKGLESIAVLKWMKDTQQDRELRTQESRIRMHSVFCVLSERIVWN